jgi:hypothetical protein
VILELVRRRRVSIGRLGSTDLVILRLNAAGLYLSVRFGTPGGRHCRRLWVAAGRNYDLDAGIR